MREKILSENLKHFQKKTKKIFIYADTLKY